MLRSGKACGRAPKKTIVLVDAVPEDPVRVEQGLLEGKFIDPCFPLFLAIGNEDIAD